MKIKCPHCKQEFSFDDAGASDILAQIRDKSFQEAVDRRISELSQILDKEHELDIRQAITDALKAPTEEIRSLQLKLDMSDKDRELALLRTQTEYEGKLKEVQAELAYYKDLKAKQSVKMIGETLEQHCEAEFNRIRMVAFPNAEFGKDNKVSLESGSKGDYIFRDYDGDTEIVSIMFEMKNEDDRTATKKKNEHFLKELDKDRKEKKCEYAVLVSLLEPDSELYNQGIVDVSYQYEKMFVIRPQFFLPLIGLLRNAALDSLAARRELAQIKEQDADIAKFEAELEEFKSDFSYRSEQANKRLDESIADIDNTIKKLEKIKKQLQSCQGHLKHASNKAENLNLK